MITFMATESQHSENGLAFKDLISNESNKIYNSHRPNIPDHPYRILIFGRSRSRKTSALLNLINHQSDID